MVAINVKLKLAFVFEPMHPYHLLSAADRKKIQSAIDTEVYKTLTPAVLNSWENLSIEITDGSVQPEKEIEQHIRNELAKTSGEHGLAVEENPCPGVMYNYHGGMKCCTHQYPLAKAGTPWRVTVPLGTVPFTIGLGIAMNWETAQTQQSSSRTAG